MNDSTPKKHFKELDHTADLRVEIIGNSQEDLFLNAIHTLYALLGIVTGPMTTQGRSWEIIKIHGIDREDVLVRLLGELLYYAVTDKKKFVPEKVCFDKDGKEGNIALSVEGKWLPYKEADRKRANDIKAVTYHDTAIWQTPAGYFARVVMDM